MFYVEGKVSIIESIECVVRPSVIGYIADINRCRSVVFAEQELPTVNKRSEHVHKIGHFIPW